MRVPANPRSPQLGSLRSDQAGETSTDDHLFLVTLGRLSAYECSCQHPVLTRCFSLVSGHFEQAVRTQLFYKRTVYSKIFISTELHTTRS
jgi:hypothetical protein